MLCTVVVVLVHTIRWVGLIMRILYHVIPADWTAEFQGQCNIGVVPSDSEGAVF